MNQLHAHSLIHGHVIHMGATMFRPLLSHIGVDKDKASGLCDQVWVVVTGDGRATDNDKAPLEDDQGHGEADGGPASRINLQLVGSELGRAMAGAKRLYHQSRRIRFIIIFPSHPHNIIGFLMLLLPSPPLRLLIAGQVAHLAI